MQPTKEFVFTDANFSFIIRLLKEKAGIVIAEHKRDMVYGRLARRLRDLHIKTFDEYFTKLEGPGGEKELENFVNALTTNLTSFFRESHHFEHLEGALNTLLTQQPRGKRARLWSCASSSGQEPYSIAMIVNDVFGKQAAWDAKILATDIDSNMLATAQAGVYDERLVEKLPEAYRRRYAIKQKDGQYHMDDKLKKMLSFKQLNLLDSWPIKGPFDAVFCRNVVIYFNKETQKILFDKIANVMAPEAFLYIGHSENLHNISDRFKLIGKTIYQKIK